MTRPTLPTTYALTPFIVHPDHLNVLRYMYPDLTFEASVSIPRIGWDPDRPGRLTSAGPVLYGNVLRAAVGAACPAPTRRQEEAWAHYHGHKDPHPHYYVRETADGPQTIRVTDAQHWMALLLEDVQADIDAAAEQRAKAAAERAAYEERRRQLEAEDEARTVRFLADLTALGEALHAHDGGFTKAIIDHHRPDPHSYGWTLTCAGCDQGCSCDAADWPCSTVELVATTHGLEVPHGPFRLPRSTE